MFSVKDILITENIIKIAPEDTISSTLSKLSTSHDAAFVFSDKDQFMGIINPYYCLIQSSHPGNAKVEHCLFHPPRVYINDPLQKAARFFIESKVHYLPVFDLNNKFEGIVSANKLLETVSDKPGFKITIGEIGRRKNKPLVTVYETDPVSTAINLFKQYKISKLIVIGKDMKLRGILSYYDLIHFLISPREKLHQGEREGNKIALYHQPVRNFAKTNVITLQGNSTMAEAIALVLEKGIGSVVVVDQERHPIHVITKRDFLNIVTRAKIKKQVQVISKNISLQNKQMLNPFFDYLINSITKLPGILKAKVVVKEERDGGVFRVVLSLINKKGKDRIITHEGRNLKEIISEIKDKILGYKR